MPYLNLRTNSSVSKEQSSELLTQLSQLLAKETGKSERYVMIEINGEREMTFSGHNEPLAYIECKSIGLTSEQAKSLSASLCQAVEARLQIKADRVYIEFSDCPAAYWGWNGSTFG